VGRTCVESVENIESEVFEGLAVMHGIMPIVMAKLFFPAYHWMKRDGLLQAISGLERSQWKTSEELYALQSEKLSRLLKHCETNVPYYTGVFSDIGCSADELLDYNNFRKLPFLTKKIINSNTELLHATDGFPHRVKKSTTSGSTGESLVFYNDHASLIERQAVVLRNQQWMGALYTGREAHLWGAQMDLDKLQSWRSRLHRFLNSTIYLSSYELSDKSMSGYARTLEKFRPGLLISYPSPLATFSRYLIDNKIRISSIKSIVTSAEKMYDWQRDLISQAFDAEIFDRYGCREFGNIAHECVTHEGYHVNSERVLLEVLDDEGNPVAIGQPGKIYITDLDNMGFPFVRYEIGDTAVISDAQCSCGRGLPLLKRIEGRSFDIVFCPNGNRVAGTFWTICLRRYEGVVRFQVVQETLNQLEIRLIVDDRYKVESETDISAEIRGKCGDEMNIQFVYVDHIELTRSGKERLVVSRLSVA